MMLSELINQLEKIYAEHGNLPVKIAENEFMELREPVLTVYLDHPFDYDLGKILEIDSK